MDANIPSRHNRESHSQHIKGILGMVAEKQVAEIIPTLRACHKAGTERHR